MALHAAKVATAPPVAVPAAACLVNISGSGCTGGAWGASEACAVVPVPPPRELRAGACVTHRDVLRVAAGAASRPARDERKQVPQTHPWCSAGAASDPLADVADAEAAAAAAGGGGVIARVLLAAAAVVLLWPPLRHRAATRLLAAGAAAREAAAPLREAAAPLLDAAAPATAAAAAAAAPWARFAAPHVASADASFRRGLSAMDESVVGAAAAARLAVARAVAALPLEEYAPWAAQAARKSGFGLEEGEYAPLDAGHADPWRTN